MKPAPILFFLIVFSLYLEEAALSATIPDTAVSDTLRVVWGLLVVLGILFVIYGFMKKKMSFLHTPGKGIIRVVEVRHLMPKKSLYLVEIRGQEFLLGAGQDRIDLIAAINRNPEGSFAEILDRSEVEMSK